MSERVPFEGDYKSEMLSGGQWFAIFDGNAKCSCGRPLVRLSKGVWQCEYGFPRYSIDEDEVMMDKFGNIYLKEKNHDPN